MRAGISAAVGAALGLMAAIAPSEAATPPLAGNVTSSTAGYTYFNLPGADVARHNIDVLGCLEASALVRSWDEVRSSGGFVGAILSNRAVIGSRAAALENCMVVKGWRVVALPTADGEALAALSIEAVTAKLAREIGAEQPAGTIVRYWANEAANGATTRFDDMPRFPGEGMLSYRIATGRTNFQPETSRSIDWPTPTLRSILKQKTLTPATLSEAPEGSAIVLVNVVGITPGSGLLVFQRVGAGDLSLPSPIDHGPSSIVVGGSGRKTINDFLIFALPPGRWRLASLYRNLIPLNFCLGAPSFEITTGDVVDLGKFNLSAADLTPDLSLDAPRAFLAGSPQADRLRAAAYVNGSRGVCGGGAIYALEFRDAPFEPDYRWGSRFHFEP